MTHSTLKLAIAQAAVEQMTEFLTRQDIHFSLVGVRPEALECSANLSDGSRLSMTLARGKTIESRISVQYPNEIQPAIALGHFQGAARISLGNAGYGGEEEIKIPALNDLMMRLQEAADSTENSFTLPASASPKP